MTKKRAAGSRDAQRIMIEIVHREVERAKLETKLIVQANRIMKEISWTQASSTLTMEGS
jgi:hypothetical protein